MSERFILAIDQGTSATKAVIFDTDGNILAKHTAALDCIFPRPGFVEQDPQAIYNSVLDAVRGSLESLERNHGGKPHQIACCGISNQRETFCLWDSSGSPLTNAIVWQCKRSVDICSRLKGTAIEGLIRQKTGLVVDPYFSATKLIWLIEHDPRICKAIADGSAMFGTVDTWLLYRMTRGASFLTDYTNASRTLLFDIRWLGWDESLVEGLGLNGLRLPDARPSTFEFGRSDIEGLLPRPIPITAMAGDSHAAAFGECLQAGMAKATLGTGCSILLNTGNKPVESSNGMVTTICWSIADRVDYALEGIIVSCGSTIAWLRDQLGLFSDIGQTEQMAIGAQDCSGVYLIPAFSGLGAPHWHMDMRAAIVGMTFSTNKDQVVRAGLESIAYQVMDVITAMEKDSGMPIKQLHVDGGITSNTFVMQMLADLLGKEVVNIGIQDVSALGAAYLAGLQRRLFSGLEYIASLATNKTTYRAGDKRDRVIAAYAGWLAAIRRLAGSP